MDSGLTYEHKEGILSIPTESKLGKKKNVQYYFKLDKGTLSWYSKASDKKPKGSLALFTATEIKRQGGLTVAINFHEGGAGMSTLALNCQSEADSEDWVMRLTQSMVVSHADPEQQQQQQAQKAHPRYSIFVRNKGTSVAEPTPIIVNESSSPVHPQHQARPVTMAPRGSASTDGTGKSVMPGFVGASTRAGNRLTNIFSMSVHRKPRVEANDSEWVNVSNSDGGSESPAGKEEADDFVVVGGNSPTPAVTAAAAKVDETNEKRSSYDELTSGKSNVAETGQPTLCLDDDDIVIVSNNNSSNSNLAPAVPPVNISKHARRSANFTSTLFVPSSLKKYEDVDDGKAEDKKSDSNDNAVSANSTVMSAVKNTEEKVTEKPKQESSEKAKDEDRATNPFVDTEEEKAPEEAQRKEEEDKKDNEEEEKKKAEEPEDKSVAADAKPQTAEKKEGKEEKDTTVAEVNVPEEKEIEAVTASSAATETKPVQKLVEKEPEPKEETDKKDEPESKEEEEEEKDDNDDSYEEEEKEKEESDEDDDDEPENDTKASEEEEKHTNKEPEQKVKEEKEEEVQPSEETLNCLSDEFAKDCDFDFSDTVTFEDGYMANLSVSKTSYEENLASVKGTFKYDSSGYTIINRPSDFTELIALSFPPGFIGINASGILIDRSPDGIWSLNSQGRVVYGSCKDDIILQKKYLLYDAIHRKDKELESLFRDELKLLEENLQGEEEHIFAFSDDLKLCYRSGEWMILSIYKPPVNFSDDDLKETSDDDKRKIGLSLFMSKKDTSQDAQQAAPAQQPQQQQQQQTQTSSSSSSAWSFMSSLKFGRKDTENAPPPERPPKPESLTIKAGEVSKTTPNPTPESSAPEQVAPAATPSSGDAPLAAHAAVASPQVAPAKASAEGSAEVHEGSKEEKKKGTGWSLFSKTLTDMKDTISSTLPKTMDEFLSSDEPDRPAQNTSEKETAVRGDASNAPPPVPPVPAAPAAMPADREPKEFKTLRSNVSLAEKEFKKAISEPGNDRVNKSIGIIIRAKVCYSIIIILSEHFKSERRFALTVYHLWDWIDSYSGIVSSSDAFDSIKATILSLNASSFKSDKNRKLRTFFCHAINNKSLGKWIMLLASDQTRINKFFKDESILKDGDKLTDFLAIIKVLDSLNFALSDDFEDQLK